MGQDFEAVRYEYVTSRGLPTTIGLVFFWRGKTTNLDIQIPGEDRCLNPQTSPELRLWKFLSHRSSPAMTGGFWMSRVIEGIFGCLGRKEREWSMPKLGPDPIGRGEWVWTCLLHHRDGFSLGPQNNYTLNRGEKPGILKDDHLKGTEKMSNWLWRWQFVVLSLPNFR